MITLVSKENIKSLLSGVLEYINNNINNITLTEENLAKLDRINRIKTDGDGLKFLNNIGEYVSIDVDTLNSMYEDIQTIYNLFSITKDESSNLTHNLVLPDNIQSKLDIIELNGDGSKALADNGTYVDIIDVVVNELTDEEIQTIIDEINNM